MKGGRGRGAAMAAAGRAGGGGGSGVEVDGEKTRKAAVPWILKFVHFFPLSCVFNSFFLLPWTRVIFVKE